MKGTQHSVVNIENIQTLFLQNFFDRTVQAEYLNAFA